MVNEDAGTFSVDVNMEILNGNLSSLAVVFSTKDGTATCMSVAVSLSGVMLGQYNPCKTLVNLHARIL